MSTPTDVPTRPTAGSRPPRREPARFDGPADVKAPPDPRAPLCPATRHRLDTHFDLIGFSRIPLRVITQDPVVAGRPHTFAGPYPSLKLAALFLPDLPGERSPSS
ncbi:hypothetical protein [Catenulispora pinisilvae]|uniref:hypothetical protein n=1 Tax=Catenulispora pinisilvae TaxID=2705253 RepID=UPI0018926103|nr:hypothetical protein [Catenulispora pinisilvae]